MPTEPTSEQIALLCAIGEFDASKAAAGLQRDLHDLIDRGYVEPDDAQPGRFKLTKAGMEFLGERGAGLNEG